MALSMQLGTGMDYFLGLSIFELLDLCDDFKELNKRK